MLRNVLAIVYHTSISAPLLASLLAPLAVHAQPARDLRMEYRKTERGGYTGILKNQHGAAATAYIAQATFRHEGKQHPTAWGGDTMAFPSGGYPLPPGSVTDTNNALPPGAEPLTTGIMAAIYADGYTEGDQSVIQMLLAGRHRSYLDLTPAIQWLEQAAAGKMDGPALNRKFQEVRDRNLAEAKQLDDLISVPSVRYAIFMTAAPNHAIGMLQTVQKPDGLLPVALTLAAEYRKWLALLRESKPDIK